MTIAPFFSEQRPLTGGGLALVMYGELDYDTAPFVRRAVDAALRAADGPVVLDLGAVLSADAFGLAVLLKAQHAHGASLANVSPAIATVLRDSNFPARFKAPRRKPAAAA
jgi:anti-anti-sigma factor